MPTTPSRPAALRSPAPLLLAPLMVLAACASGPEPIPFDGPAAPAPYTVEQIRASNRPVTTLVYHITEPDEPLYVQVRVFLSDEGEAARVVTTTETEDGESGSEFDMDVPWTLWRDLALYPADATVRTEESVTVLAGTFDCWRYTVQGEWQEEPAVKVYWYDRATAGSPVLHVVERDGAEVYRMELVEHDRHPIPDDGEETGTAGVEEDAAPDPAPQP